MQHGVPVCCLYVQTRVVLLELAVHAGLAIYPAGGWRGVAGDYLGKGGRMPGRREQSQ